MALAVGVTLGAVQGEGTSGGEFDRRMAEAARLHDAGKYDAAIVIYRDLLKDYPKNPSVIYELAYSSLSGGKPKDAIDYAEKGLKQKSPYSAQCYQVMGNAYDALGDFAKSERTYRRGLRESPHDGPLHFNLGVNLVMQKKMDAGISEFLESTKDNPGHASSWRALGVAYKNLGQRARAFVAFARFLTLEPDTERSRAVSPQLWALLFEGVRWDSKDGGSPGTNITIPAPGKNDDVAATSELLMMSIVAASRHLDEWKDKSDAQFFAGAFDKVLAILGELGTNDKRQDPLWTATARYFTSAREAEHLEAMAYDIRRSLADPETVKWLDAHTEAVDRYREWSKNWKPSAE